MKVKELMKKINYGTAKIPVYYQEGISGEPRKAESFDYAGYSFEEQDKTVCSIDLRPDKIVVYYK